MIIFSAMQQLPSILHKFQVFLVTFVMKNNYKVHLDLLDIDPFKGTHNSSLIGIQQCEVTKYGNFALWYSYLRHCVISIYGHLIKPF